MDVNPKGRVPAMSTARGILTETPAILAYVAQSFPQARLAPLDDPFAFAQLQAFNSFLCSGLHVAHAHWPAKATSSGAHRAALDAIRVASDRRITPSSSSLRPLALSVVLWW